MEYHVSIYFILTAIKWPVLKTRALHITNLLRFICKPVNELFKYHRHLKLAPQVSTSNRFLVYNMIYIFILLRLKQSKWFMLPIIHICCYNCLFIWLKLGCRLYWRYFRPVKTFAQTQSHGLFSLKVSLRKTITIHPSKYDTLTE